MVLLFNFLLQATNQLFNLIDNLLKFSDRALRNAHQEFNTSARCVLYGKKEGDGVCVCVRKKEGLCEVE